jgi:hypothetical protein
MTTFSSTNQPETRGAGGQKRHKVMRNALMLALEREVADADGKMTKRINMVADKLVRRAMDDGDVAAIREILDRVDGKVAQPVGGSDELPPHKMVFGWMTASSE